MLELKDAILQLHSAMADGQLWTEQDAGVLSHPNGARLAIQQKDSLIHAAWLTFDYAQRHAFIAGGRHSWSFEYSTQSFCAFVLTSCALSIDPQFDPNAPMRSVLWAFKRALQARFAPDAALQALQNEILVTLFDKGVGAGTSGYIDANGTVYALNDPIIPKGLVIDQDLVRAWFDRQHAWGPVLLSKDSPQMTIIPTLTFTMPSSAHALLARLAKPNTQA